jgi:hypothetical protein
VGLAEGGEGMTDDPNERMDTRRFKSSEEMANAIFGSVPQSDEARLAAEAAHRAAQVPPPVVPEVKPKGWQPRGSVTSATAERGLLGVGTPVTEREMERMKRKAMMDSVHDARGRR